MDLLKSSEKEKKNSPFKWPETAQEAFLALINTFTTAPTLVHFDLLNAIRVETDASRFAIAAAILQQIQESDDQAHWHPIAYWSRKMIQAERGYETHDAELLAIVMAFKQWRHYLEGSWYPIEVITDHNNLKYFMTTKELNGRQARWALRLAAFNFVI